MFGFRSDRLRSDLLNQMQKGARFLCLDIGGRDFADSSGFVKEEM